MALGDLPICIPVLTEKSGNRGGTLCTAANGYRLKIVILITVVLLFDVI